MSSIEHLQELMNTCVEIGFVRGQVAMSPSSDKIRKKDAEALLALHGMQKSLLQRWVDNRLIIENKGENNSPKWYSRIEILKVIGAIKYQKCI